ncbi:me53 [Malacosoma neustria nucleopolyhedrovirus]|uniref:me53 n=1 Tax=Malacosoma neustria nuclear polyhedrosis virus TaxID=38012 RepID=UPI000E36069A|nr:me53 [Malacosoma neustria nucleopolyhedrovirus]AUF81545.1 me53 [Malacosoma neustria nucleopolyhedrovirus]
MSKLTRSPPSSPPSSILKIEDLRYKFLNSQSYELLKFVFNFATDYAEGKYRVNNLPMMRCMGINRSKDTIRQTKCDSCAFKFNKVTKNQLFCIVNVVISLVDEKRRKEKFKLVCGKCLHKYTFCDMFVTYEMYPRLNLSSVEELCDHGFITAYIFPIRLMEEDRDYEIVVNVYKDVKNNVYDNIKAIVNNKKSNEMITKIEYSTYNKVVFVENVHDFFVVKNPSTGRLAVKMMPDNSPMLAQCRRQNVRPRSDETIYFYEVRKKVYLHDHNYIIYIWRSCNTYCVKCETKFYKKINPILYCSTCGFTDYMYFTRTHDNLDVFDLDFYKKCIKTNNSINCKLIYYDMKLYNKMISDKQQQQKH